MTTADSALSGLHAEAIATPGTPLRLEGMFNLRDLGGYPTAAGGYTRTGRMFRADSLAHLTDADLAHVEALGLSIICDLRRPEELESTPNRLPPGARYHHNPMILNVNVMGDYRLPDYDWSVFRLESLFIQMLDESGETFRRVFELLAESDSYPFLFHCAAGKDRTGTVAALLLRTAGVSDETICSDFARSHEHIQPRIQQFRERLRKRGANADAADKLFGAPAEAMTATLAHLDARYGSTRGYLDAIGVPGTHIAAFLSEFTAF